MLASSFSKFLYCAAAALTLVDRFSVSLLLTLSLDMGSGEQLRLSTSSCVRQPLHLQKPHGHLWEVALFQCCTAVTFASLFRFCAVLQLVRGRGGAAAARSSCI